MMTIIMMELIKDQELRLVLKWKAVLLVLLKILTGKESLNQLKRTNFDTYYKIGGVFNDWKGVGSLRIIWPLAKKDVLLWIAVCFTRNNCEIILRGISFMHLRCERRFLPIEFSSILQRSILCFCLDFSRDNLLENIKTININKNPRGKIKPSDHTPIELEII